MTQNLHLFVSFVDAIFHRWIINMMHRLMRLLIITLCFRIVLILSLCDTSVKATLILKNLHSSVEQETRLWHPYSFGYLLDWKTWFTWSILFFLNRLKTGISSDNQNRLLTVLLFVVLEYVCTHSTVDTTIVLLERGLRQSIRPGSNNINENNNNHSRDS